jgi:catechol 2,3-dioxygenase-like lactoylglutathione lyase family enzyme
MEILELNHIAIQVADVARSEMFYREVLLLPAIPRPAFDFPGAWFRLGEQELHLIGEEGPLTGRDHRANHFAVRVANARDWERRLSDAGVPVRPCKTRPDGAMQVFAQDPDGHWIEFMQPVSTASNH